MHYHSFLPSSFVDSLESKLLTSSIVDREESFFRGFRGALRELQA